MVDRIEANIVQSTNYVEKAVADTEQAVTNQRKARKVRGHGWRSCQLQGNRCPRVNDRTDRSPLTDLCFLCSLFAEEDLDRTVPPCSAGYIGDNISARFLRLRRECPLRKHHTCIYCASQLLHDAFFFFLPLCLKISGYIYFSSNFLIKYCLHSGKRN